MTTKRYYATTPEGMRLKREDRDTLGSWTVYGVYLEGQRIGSINGPDTSGWSVGYGPDLATETTITSGWSSPRTRYDACWLLRSYHLDAVARTTEKT